MRACMRTCVCVCVCVRVCVRVCVCVCVCCCTEFSLSVNFKKTNFLVAGYGIVRRDCDNIMVQITVP